MNQYRIELRIAKNPFAMDISEDPVESTVSIDASGHDLVNVWAEMLHQMPDALFYAFEVALRKDKRGALS